MKNYDSSVVDVKKKSKKERFVVMMSLETRLKKARKLAGFSQKALADKLSITERTLQRYEKNASKMPADTLKGISFICAVNPRWLLFGEGQIQEKEDIDTPGRNVARVFLPGNKTQYSLKNVLKDSPLDYALLKKIIKAIEKYLLVNQVELTVSRKAELIVILYEQFDTAEFDSGTFERFMRLAIEKNS